MTLAIVISASAFLLLWSCLVLGGRADRAPTSVRRDSNLELVVVFVALFLLFAFLPWT